MSSRILMALGTVLVAGCLALLVVWQQPSADGRPAERVPGQDGRSADSRAAAEPLPAPSGEPVLRVTGVKRGNAEPRTTEIDFTTLDRLARERLTVHEPFLKRDVTFTGVRLSELLSRAGVAPSAARLTLHALDDYQVELPMAEVASEGFLAVRAEGKPIEIADGGPIRLVFASDSGLGANTDNWIWSIDTMRARR